MFSEGELADDAAERFLADHDAPVGSAHRRGQGGGAAHHDALDDGLTAHGQVELARIGIAGETDAGPAGRALWL